jgi:hypothetical protein
MLAGRFGDKIGGVLSGTPASDTLITVISYAIIIALTIVAARFIWKAIRPVVSLATLGTASLVDRVGGLALGLVLGFVIIGAIIIAMARFTYNFDLPGEGIAGAVADRIPKVEDTREGVESALTESAVVPPFITVAKALPGNALGFVPSDFMISLEILEQNIED